LAAGEFNAVVISNTRQPAAGAGLKALSAAKAKRGAAAAAAAKVADAAAVLMKVRRSMMVSGIS
jgi:hypothetical protein